MRLFKSSQNKWKKRKKRPSFSPSSAACRVLVVRCIQGHKKRDNKIVGRYVGRNVEGINYRARGFSAGGISGKVEKLKKRNRRWFTVHEGRGGNFFVLFDLKKSHMLPPGCQTRATSFLSSPPAGCRCRRRTSSSLRDPSWSDVPAVCSWHWSFTQPLAVWSTWARGEVVNTWSHLCLTNRIWVVCRCFVTFRGDRAPATKSFPLTPVCQHFKKGVFFFFFQMSLDED